MATITLTKEEVAALIFSRTSTSKYPWYETEVDAGFFVPRTDLPREEYRPSCPPSLRAAGQKWITRSATYGDVKGLHVIRTV